MLDGYCLCLVILLSSEQCSQFEIFRQQHVQMVNKPSSLKTKLVDKNAEETASIPFDV